MVIIAIANTLGIAYGVLEVMVVYAHVTGRKYTLSHYTLTCIVIIKSGLHDM